jgi:hypothetical protein
MLEQEREKLKNEARLEEDALAMYSLSRDGSPSRQRSGIEMGAMSEQEWEKLKDEARLEEEKVRQRNKWIQRVAKTKTAMSEQEWEKLKDKARLREEEVGQRNKRIPMAAKNSAKRKEKGEPRNKLIQRRRTIDQTQTQPQLLPHGTLTFSGEAQNDQDSARNMLPTYPIKKETT